MSIISTTFFAWLSYTSLDAFGLKENIPYLLHWIPLEIAVVLESIVGLLGETIDKLTTCNQVALGILFCK